MVALDSFTMRLRSAVTQSGGATHVAQTSGIPLSTLNNYLAGRSEPKRQALATLARVLRRDLAWLLTGDEAGSGTPPRTKLSPRNGAMLADADLLAEVMEAMLSLYAEMGRHPLRAGIGRKCAQIHNAIAATAENAHERRRMLDLAVALHRQELAGDPSETSGHKME